ncbi:MAG: PAS domain-containing protein [Myxococcota bacterium]
MSFVPQDVINQLGNLSQSEADGLPFGVIKVDNDGVVSIYNQWESKMAGVAKDQAVGQNFFKEVAPCTNNRLVYGRFKKGVESGLLDSVVPYTFTYRMNPTNVDLHLYRDTTSETNWVFVKTA